MFSMLPVLSLIASFGAQDPLPQKDPAPRSTTPTVTVPTFPNSTCPIMGKKASLPLFADTELGRIYVCCKPCIRKVHADVQKAYETAYPATKDLANKVCPISGEPIGAEPFSTVLQGVRFRLCCEGCLAQARQHTQITLAKVLDPNLDDAQNQRCPVDGQPVQPNAFAVVGTTIVRLSSPAHLAELQKSPQALLDKARAEGKGDGPKPAHRHPPTPGAAQPEAEPRAEAPARQDGA